MLSRRSLLAAPALVAGTLPVFARAPLAGGSSPLVHRFKVGSFEVTAVGDGWLSLPLDLFPAAKADPAAAEALLRQSGLRPGPIRSFVNTYLVNTGDRLVLIDAGLGPAKAFGPDLGKLPANLQAAGVDAGSIDAVLVTHMHPDHVGGLAPDGKPAFPNAEIVVGEAEHAFWTDAGIAARAPADAQPFFKLAQDAVAPYAARVRKAPPGEVLPGFSFVAAPGHTPGHVAVRVASGTDQLLVWGDVMHVVALQFDQPDWSNGFDADQAAAARTRRQVYDMAAADGLMVAGMHLPFPGVGRVVRRGSANAFLPAEWQG